MKTLRKAIWGLVFLAPLFLPSQTKAGPFDDWYRSEFGTQRQVQGNPYDRNPYDAFQRPSDFNSHRPGQDAFRPFDPWSDRNGAGNGQGQGGDPGSPNSVPIDGGLVFLLVAGLGLGVCKIYLVRKRTVAAVA